MSKINWVYHEKYDIPLKLNHRFTSSKFSDLFYELKKTVLYKNAIINQPKKANIIDLSISHSVDYINKKIGRAHV